MTLSMNSSHRVTQVRSNTSSIQLCFFYFNLIINFNLLNSLLISESEYPVDIEDIEEEPNPKYIVKFLEQNDRPPVDYEYKIVKKKSSRFESPTRKESSFRERSHHPDNDRLRDLFSDSNEKEKNEALQDRAENDAEYALLLSQLWAKYKNNKVHGNIESAPPGIVKLYKEKVVKKRYPDNWGPIAFKRKRSSDSDIERPVIPDYEPERTQAPITSDANYNAYDVSDNDKDDDWRDEYAIAFQPLDDTLSDTADEDQYSYESVQKRFPVTKRSSGPYYNTQKKRFVQSQNKHNKAKTFRSSAGTDPRIIKDLSKIFGGMEMKSPVKRNVNMEESHETKPPQLIMLSHNHNHTQNATKDDDDSHEQQGHSLHHPGMSGKESEHGHDHIHDHEIHSHDKPIKIKKKSIDWSDYFGIDKRSKKFVHDVNENRLKQQYLDTFNKEVVYPLNSFRRHTNVKRNYVEPNPSEESITQSDDKRNAAEDNTNAKIENLDKNLRNVEDLIVDEALHYSNGEEELDSKEEQEIKEKMLQKLATAYSLEKMRKALKEFKQSLQTQRTETSQSSLVPSEISKTKRVAVKKEKVDIRDNEIPALDKVQVKDDDFEAEEGAGHYLNGKIDHQLSEGYMDNSGRHRTPLASTGKLNFFKICFLDTLSVN